MNNGIFYIATAASLLLMLALAVVTGWLLQKAFLRQLNQRLIPTQPPTDTVDLSTLSSLPAPVQRYFRFALTDHQPLIIQMDCDQKGMLKADIHDVRWMHFKAHHTAVSQPAAFLWNAKITASAWLRIHVTDSFTQGAGISRASLFGIVPVATDQNLAPLNEGALHRYLAEAVWYPTALLPQSGVVWTPIDEYSALATVSEGNVTVSLTFHFGEKGEITKISTSGRYRKTRSGYQKTPWEGHFSGYAAHSGMQIPMQGEVGWYVGDFDLVWKGAITHLDYRF